MTSSKIIRTVLIILINAIGRCVKNRPLESKKRHGGYILVLWPLLGLFAGLFYGLPANAWSQDPHRLICEIAWLELAPPQRKQLAERVKASGHSRFNDSCVWADKVRQVPRYRFSGPLHYMNVPRGNARLGASAECDDCILEALREMRKIAVGTPSKRYQTTQAEALLMLAHLLGDLHQPLHVGFADDKGGNAINLSVNGKPWSLHGLWDNALPRRVTGRNWQVTARRWQAEITDEQRQHWSAGNETRWAEESFQLTREIYTRLPENGRVDDSWLNQYNDPVREQLLKAAVRLGVELKALLGHGQ
jgi:hypothetical protein